MSRRVAAQSNYNPSVDLLRLFASYALVLFHSALPLSEVGEPAAAFFAAVTVYFALAAFQRSSKGPMETLRKRSGILLPMFGMWCGIYIAAIIAKEVATGGDPMADIIGFMPPHGSLKQFWFLPWSLAVCAVVIAVAARLTQAPPIGVAVAAMAVFLIAVCGLLSATHLPLIFHLCILYAPAAAFGALLWRLRDAPRAALMTGAALCALGWLLWGLGLEGTSQARFAIPILALAFVMRAPVPAGLAQKAGQVSGDIYLVHLLVIPALAIVVQEDSIAMGLLAVIGSTAAALVLSRCRTGFALPGRPIFRHI